MMAKTHYFVGMATSLLVVQPTDTKSVLLALMGGALGGVAADIDIVELDNGYQDDKYKDDALIGQLLAFGTAGAVLLLDHFMNFGILESILGSDNVLSIAGAIMYLVLMAVGFGSKHRTFTHSFLAMILFSAAAYMILPWIVIPYATGYLSHLCLDILNKKRVPIFYPLGKGICLKLCYAKGAGNTFFMIVGIIGTVLLVINGLFFRLY